jgi:hypothetical protein
MYNFSSGVEDETRREITYHCPPQPRAGAGPSDINFIKAAKEIEAWKANFPPVLQKSFSPPTDGYFLAGSLKVEHHLPPINFLQQRVLGIIPPPGKAVRTVVRHTRDGGGGALTWRRAFDRGAVFFTSVWAMSAEAPDRGSEAIAGIHFVQRLALSRVSDGSVGADGAATAGRVRLTLMHESSTLFGLVPLPSFVMRPHCVMNCHADGKGYDLTVEVWLHGLLLGAVDRASGSVLIQPAMPGLVMRPQDGQLQR